LYFDDRTYFENESICGPPPALRYLILVKIAEQLENSAHNWNDSEDIRGIEMMIEGVDRLEDSYSGSDIPVLKINDDNSYRYSNRKRLVDYNTYHEVLQVIIRRPIYVSIQRKRSKLLNEMKISNSYDHEIISN